MRSTGRAGAHVVVAVSVGGSFLEPGPESEEDKKQDAVIAPGKRTFQYNVPWGGALIRLGDGGLPRRVDSCCGTWGGTWTRCRPNCLPLDNKPCPNSAGTSVCLSRSHSRMASCPKVDRRAALRLQSHFLLLGPRDASPALALCPRPHPRAPRPPPDAIRNQQVQDLRSRRRKLPGAPPATPSRRPPIPLPPSPPLIRAPRLLPLATQLQQQIEVWEAPCRACNGSGFANARKSRRRESFPSTCLLCNGIGAPLCFPPLTAFTPPHLAPPPPYRTRAAGAAATQSEHEACARKGRCLASLSA